MKIFLTGGTGFISTHFINKAHEDGHKLVCLRRPESHTRIPIESEPIWVEGSMEDDWSEEMSHCEVLVYLAAHRTNVPYDTLENCFYWNVTILLQLLQNARIAGIRKFIVARSGFECGLSGEDFEFIPVDAPL